MVVYYAVYFRNFIHGYYTYVNNDYAYSLVMVNVPSSNVIFVMVVLYVGCSILVRVEDLLLIYDSDDSLDGYRRYS